MSFPSWFLVFSLDRVKQKLGQIRISDMLSNTDQNTFLLIGTYSFPARTPVDIIEKVQRLVAFEEAAASRQAEPSTISDFQGNILDKIEKAIFFHIERGEERNLERGEGWRGLSALDGLYDVFANFSASVEGADDEAIDKLINAVSNAISKAKGGAEWDMVHDVPDFGPAFLQCKELDGSELLELLRCWTFLETIRRRHRDGIWTEAKMWQSVADVMMNAPGYPQIIKQAPVIQSGHR